VQVVAPHPRPLPVRRSDRRVDLAGVLLVTLFTTSLLLITFWGGDRYRR